MWNINYNQYRDFSGSPEVGTLPSNAEGMGSRPGQEVKTLHVSWPKNQSIKREQYLTNSVRTLKMVHIKKIFRLAPVKTCMAF